MRELREAKGLSQEEMAFASDSDRSYISLLEREHRNPSLKKLYQFAQALDLPFPELAQKIDARARHKFNKSKKTNH